MCFGDSFAGLVLFEVTVGFGMILLSISEGLGCGGAKRKQKLKQQ